MSDARNMVPIGPEGQLGPVDQHPGHTDPAYLRRRAVLAEPATGHVVGRPSPPVHYTEAEHATWRTVHAALAPALRAYACREVLEAREDALIPADHIPQHEEVGARLRPRTGFGFTLAGGFVPNERFLGSMAEGYFHAVQFVRHPAAPLYTPEPDVLHDVFGHGTHLVCPRFADLYRLFGRTAVRLHTEEALNVLSQVYWFTLEFGLVMEGGTPKAYGAALLSSPGELARLPGTAVEPLDTEALTRTSYRVEGYQPLLFAARSFSHLTDTLAAYCDTFSDDTVSAAHSYSSYRA